MAQKIRENLWRLEIPLVGNPLKNLNSYLITGERNLLIDTGFRQKACGEAMERQLRELGVDRDRTDIFLTHHHSDHAGLSTDLIRPGCRIYIGAAEGAMLRANREESRWEVRSEQLMREGFSKAEMEAMWGHNPAKTAGPLPYGDYVSMRDGDTLGYGGWNLRCVETPGHTPGHMCLLDEGAGLLFSGDHVLFHITPNICRWAEMTDALGSYLESLESIRRLPVKLLLPAHREETGELDRRAGELIAHHHCRIEETWQVVRDHPGLNAYEIAGRMTWSIRSKNWETFPLTQKFFAVGEALAHLDYLAERSRVECAAQNGVHVYVASGIG